MTDAIGREMRIAEVVHQHPETVLVFLAHGLMCLGCAGALSESIEEGALTHGIDIEALVKDLNAAVVEQAGGTSKA